MMTKSFQTGSKDFGHRYSQYLARYHSIRAGLALDEGNKSEAIINFANAMQNACIYNQYLHEEIEENVMQTLGAWNLGDSQGAANLYEELANQLKQISGLPPHPKELLDSTIKKLIIKRDEILARR